MKMSHKIISEIELFFITKQSINETQKSIEMAENHATLVLNNTINAIKNNITPIKKRGISNRPIKIIASCHE